MAETRIVRDPAYAEETESLLDKIGPVESPTYPEVVAGRAESPDPAYAGTPDPTVTISDLLIPLHDRAASVRTYTPTGSTTRPLVLWLHGGGFIGGAARDLDTISAGIALAADVTLVSLDYRLAPESPYPAALDDVVETLGWLADHGPTLGGNGQIAIGGQSAGGNIAAAACLRVRDEGRVPADAQVLCYPSLDFGRETESARAFNGVFLDVTPGRWTDHAYLAGHEPDAYSAPLRASCLRDLPPALVIGAGRDPLRDHARTYARRLDADGVVVDHVEYEATMHALLNFPAVLSAASHAVETIASYLQRTLADGGAFESTA